MVSRGIFAQRDDGRYELNPMAELLRTDAPVSMAAMARFVGARHHREHWSLLTEAIKTGGSVVPALRGKDFFDYLGDEPEFAQIFNDAMTGLSGAAIGPVVDAYDFTPSARSSTSPAAMAVCSLPSWHRHPTRRACSTICPR